MNKIFHSEKRTAATTLAVIVFVILLIIPALLGIFYADTNKNLTDQVDQQQQTVASITASATKIKIDRLVEIATAMASSPQLISSVANNQWDAAANVTRDLQNNTTYYDTYIDRVVLFDKNGTEQSAYPTLSSGIGSNASSSAWYQAINNGASTYLSSVTQRTAVPRINVINIATPVKQNGNSIGMLVFQIPTANFLEFGESAALGTYGFIYILDANGNIIIHPKYPANNGVVNLASTAAAQLALTNKAGMLTLADESYSQGLMTFQAVPVYDWEVVTQEPSAEAFATRDSILHVIAWEVIAALLIDLFISCTIFFVMTKRKNRK